MDIHEETFKVTVQINPGLEPMTFTVTPEERTANRDYEIIFKLSRDKDKETIAELARDNDHHWQQITGNLDKEDVETIGAAIDVHHNP